MEHNINQIETHKMYLKRLLDTPFMNFRMYFFIVFWHFCSEFLLLSVWQLAITVKIVPNCFFILRRPLRFGFIFLDFKISLMEVPFNFGIWFILFLSASFKEDGRGLSFENSTNLKVRPPLEMPIVDASGSWKSCLKQKVQYNYNHDIFLTQWYFDFVFFPFYLHWLYFLQYEKLLKDAKALTKWIQS